MWVFVGFDFLDRHMYIFDKLIFKGLNMYLLANQTLDNNISRFSP